MTVHRVTPTEPLIRPKHLEKELPAPPSDHLHFYHAQISGPARRPSSTRDRYVKRSATAPVLPTLSKTTTIHRRHDYTPGRSVTVSRVPPQRVSLRLSPPRSYSEPLPGSRSHDKPLPNDPPVSTTVMTDSSNTSTERSSSSAPTSTTETHSPSDDPVTGESSSDIEPTNVPPTPGTLDKVADLTVLDKDEKEVSFKSLYWPQNEEERVQGRKVMIIFIRHFFCGNCQEYIRHLSEEISPSSLPPRTSIVIVGCGAPSLIPFYIKETSTRFPIYADPSTRLYEVLGMAKTYNLGPKNPDYIRRSIFGGIFQSIGMGLSRAGKGDMIKFGDLKQVGGEFLFNVKGAKEGSDKTMPGNSGLKSVEVTWCHHMRNTRDHAEIPIIGGVLRSGKGIGQTEMTAEKPTEKIESRSTTRNTRRSLSSRRPSWMERRRSSTRNRNHSTGRTSSTKTDAAASLDEKVGLPQAVPTVAEGHEPPVCTRSVCN